MPLFGADRCIYSVTVFWIKSILCLCVDWSVRHFSEGSWCIVCMQVTMTNSKKDQRQEIKFCVQSGVPREETVRHIRQVHGQNALSVWSIHRWYTAFENERVETNDLPRPGQPKMHTPGKIQQIDQVVRQDRRQVTVRQVAGRSNVSVGTAFKTLRKDLGLKKKCAHWVPHHLTDDQKRRHVDRCRAALRCLRRNGEVDHIICCDETWFYVCDPPSCCDNHQWLACNAPTPAVPLHEQSTLKAMLLVFFDEQGLLYCCFVPQGQGVNGAFYLQVLQELCDAVRRRRPQVWCAQHWGILHDGAPAHWSLPVQNWFQQMRVPQVLHPVYSPDLNPPDYWLFSMLKRKVRGELFPDLQQLRATVDREMGLIPQHEWCAAMECYVPRLHKCIQAQGSYFEHE